MYCERCKKKFPDEFKFCDICGNELIKKEKNIKTKNSPKDKKRNNTILIISMIVFGLILVIGSTIFFITSLFKYLDKISTLEYIELDKDKIPTMYVINENIQIDSYNKEIDFNEIEVEIEYYYDLIIYDALNMYKELLEEEGFTYIGADDDDWNFVKSSVDVGYVVKISIEKDYDSDGILYSIKYEKEKDDISKYIKEITYKRVGEEKYGFIDIDSMWQPYMSIDSNDMIQYSGQDGMLILYYIENPTFNAREYMNTVYSYISKEGVTNLNIIEVTVDGYDAYQLTGYSDFEKMNIAIWCFLDKNNIMHYIEIDNIDYDSEVFSKINSYSVLK